MNSPMTADLLISPRWKAEHLGFPMPDSVHAVSACLPLWEHNIRYEQGDAEVVSKLKAAYPRFCLHPFVRQLCRQVFGSDSSGLIFPTRKSAERALCYVKWRGVTTASLVPVAGQPFCGVAIDPKEFSTLKEYWQHAGEVISSRGAEMALRGEQVTCTATPARNQILNRLAELRGCSKEDLWIFPCGMAAIAAVWRAVRRHDPNSPSVQFGFPYVDTLKIQQRFEPAAYHFYPIGNSTDIEALRTLLKTEKVSAVFCESPTNPLLTTPDLVTLRSLADEYGFVLVIDDTLAACINQNVLPYADAVVTSLTKYFSGYGDVLAGSVMLNSASKHADRLRTALRDDFEEMLIDADAEVLEKNSRDVRERVSVINRNAEILAKQLSQHPLVDRVYHPSLNADVSSKSDGSISTFGYGGLLSVVLKNPSTTTPIVFDRLEVCKGPNLGTNFTLCCPYTILAHYTELDFVEECGVSRWLLRISIGMEPVEELWQRFERAFSTLLNNQSATGPAPVV
jgi:cystathionine gamma-synthase